MKLRHYHIVPGILFLFLAGLAPLKASVVHEILPLFQVPDTILPFPIEEEDSYPFSNSNSSPLYLNNPTNINAEIVYDPETNSYIFQEKIGEWNYRVPRVMSKEAYLDYQFREAVQDYWMMKSGGGLSDQPSFIPSISLGGEGFDKVFGSNTINIVPTGSAELIFGFNYSILDNPNISERNRRTPAFQFDEKIMMNVAGSIGDKFEMDFKYNTEATFDFEQKTKLEYAGEEDEILKKIEAGNVSLPLPGSLINGSMSLFGLKTEMQFGKLNVTTVVSQQRGESQVIEASGGVQTHEYEVSIDKYDANKHFFLSDYFRDNYDRAMSSLPIIISDVTITEVEVWVTNKTTNFTEARNILALIDLGEAEPYSERFSSSATEGDDYPRNNLNTAYDLLTTRYSGVREMKDVTSELTSAGLTLGTDYEKIENARLLSSREYSFHPKLGYISLNSALNSDEVLAVSYKYTYRGVNCEVGEVSTSAGVSAPQTLILKLLKPTNFTPNSYTWDLMMKNIYAIGAYQVQEDEFTMDVAYRDDKTGNNINYLPELKDLKTTLLRMMNLDSLDSQNEENPDGIFDFISGTTVMPQNGRIIFPMLEPFGSYLKTFLEENLPVSEANLAIDKYIYQELYDSTKTKAQQIAEKNKFLLVGTYASSGSGSDIMLNAMNVPEGSVKVTAGGRELVEGQDYTVDYTMGRVTIINQGILDSNTPVKVSMENQALYNFQTKTMLGTHLDYTISENFNVGATLLHLSERPVTEKVNIGDEPISNTIWGLNTNYSKPAPLITRIVDWMPFIETKAPSQLTVVGEFAHLIPGHSKAIDKEGNAYIDDFEGSETSIDMKQYSSWNLASTPQGYFSEAELNNDRRYGYGRAKFAWYQIDPVLMENGSSTPQHLREDPDAQSSPYVYQVSEQDIFPNKENKYGTPTRMSILNLAYYPKERGPYNFDTDRINTNGELLDPEKRWGGIMREIYSSDFEAANVEFIEFWMMDPYAGMEGRPGGELYINLGNVSEDILKDSRKMFENGLPTNETVELVDTTVWGRVPVTQSLVNAFSGGQESRKYQDVGFDGLRDEDEVSFFNDFLQEAEAKISSPEALQVLKNDPSSDNFEYFRKSDWDVQELGILDRYKHYNNSEGNSPSDLDNQESYSTSGTTLPDVEDINRDNTLSESESYFSYRIDMSPSEFEIGRNYIVDKVEDEVEYENGEIDKVNWYQFRIPIYDYETTVGGISDFKTIRFMRLFLTGFEDTVFLRFAKLDLVRGEWRRYNLPFMQGGEDWTGIEPPAGTLSISAVNIEENGKKEPVNYVLPPGFTRQIDPTQPQLRQLNEQAIVLKVLELGDGDARAAYKNTDLDIRQYKKIKMEAHAEALIDGDLEDDELTAFIRLGSDYQSNYYEYEVPLKLTPHNATGEYYSDELEADRLIVWPEENKFEIELSSFTQVKLDRESAMADPNSNVSITSVYSIIDENGNKVSVSGNPNMSSIRTIMIGVRNPKSGTSTWIDDGLPKSGEIWLNELRLSDFDESGGWAANGRASARLADFGNVTFAGSHSTVGFGSIDQKVNERSKEDISQYDISSNFEMGKFFKEEAGVSIPVYVQYSKSVVNPEYDPYKPDVRLDEALDAAATEAERDEIKRNAQDVVENFSVALTNFRIAPKKAAGKPKIYSISNWSTSASFNNMMSYNPNLDYYNTSNFKANISYNYNSRPKNVQPFKKVKAFNNKWLRMMKDFNFYYLPSRLSFRTDMDRRYLEKQTKNISNETFTVYPSFKKDFYWNRDYDVKFDLTRSLKFDFSASNIARIDENDDRYNIWLIDQDSTDYMINDLWKNIWNDGRSTSYYHQYNLSYTVPINKIPILDWLTLNGRLNGAYGWDVGPVMSNIDLGNTINNSYSFQGNGQANFVNLYNKVDYLKTINDKFRASRGRGRTSARSQEPERTKEKIFTQEKVYLREGAGRYVMHNMKTEKVKVEVFDESGQPVEHDFEILSEKRIRVFTETTIRNGRIVVTGTIDRGEDPVTFIVERAVRMAMAVRTINVTYSQSGGSLVPGYSQGINEFGFGFLNENLAPGLGYIFGIYEDDFAENAFSNGLLSKDEYLNDPVTLNKSERLTFRANVEPIKGLKIDLTGNYNSSDNTSEFFTAEDGILPNADSRGRNTRGSYSMSFMSLGSAFEPIDTLGTSERFVYLRDEARIEYGRILAIEEYGSINDAPPDTSAAGYYKGFGPTSQEVLVPAFLAAYGYQTIGSPKSSFARDLLNIRPNWSLTYDGLGKIEALSEYVNSISLKHGYRSTYSVGYVSNPSYYSDSMTYDLQGNFVVPESFNTVKIDEQFSPLIGLNMDWKNSLTTRFEYKKARSVGLNMANTQINEVRSNEYVFGAGYRFNAVPLTINGRAVSSDLNVRLDFSYRNNQTLIRKLDDSGSQITAGQVLFSLKATADYKLSEKFTVRAFYDQRLNTPYLSSSYANANYNVGFSMTFML